MALGGEKKKEKNDTTGSTSSTLRGCIKKTKGPWLVHRTNKNGETVTKFRFPSDEERLKNKQRERRRRLMSRNIFAGLKEHGNYDLPKHTDTNDLLKAVCEEAGWHVEPDGTIYRKKSVSTMAGGSNNRSSCQVVVESIGTSNNQHGNVAAAGSFLSLGLEHSHEGGGVNLMLSLSVSTPWINRV